MLVCAFAPTALAADHPADKTREARAREYFTNTVLTDQDGKQYRFYEDLLRSRVVLINVVFTTCQSACPLATARLRKVRERLGDRFGREVYFLSLSVDPGRDTPQQLKAFAAKHGADEPGWRFLTGTPDAMLRVLGRLGQWSDQAEDHSTMLIAGNASAAHWSKLRPDAPPERIVADLERVARAE